MDSRFDYKPYRCSGEDADRAWREAAAFGKVRVAEESLYWRSGLRRYCIPFAGLRRIYRRIEGVYGRLCCGGRNFDMEYLVLDLPQGGELVIHIGDDVRKTAQALLEHLKQTHPEIPYGKE